MELNQDKDTINDLSKQEFLVVSAIAKGLKNEEIAYAMNISVNTVKTYLARVYRKCAVRNRVELTIWYFNQTNK